MKVRPSLPKVPISPGIPHHAGDPRMPRARAALSLSRSGAADLVLVVGAVALALGLASVTASLAPFELGLSVRAPDAPRVAMVRDRALAMEPSGPADDPPRSPTMPRAVGGESVAVALPRTSATGPWRSPLYPQNGVTLWDRIRVSSQRDRRAFLLGTAIQMHAPAIASTPGPRVDLPPCCPRS